MANGNPLNNQEHNNLTPFEYSNPSELKIYNALSRSSATFDQTYLQSTYTGLEFKDYAGIVYISPPNPIIIPSRQRYDGIAPLSLQPSINAPYPYDEGQYNAY
jgi:hypothetical protein